MGISSWGSRALEHRLSVAVVLGPSCHHGMWDFPGSEIESVSPMLAGRFFTTEPPGKPQIRISCCDKMHLRWTILTVFKGTVVKELPAKQETEVPSLGREDPLEKEKATHSGTLTWEIPWREEPVGLLSMGSLKSQKQLSK